MNEGHNSKPSLNSLIERVERLNEEIKAVQEDRKLVFQEAVVAGYDLKAMKKVLADRKKDPQELDEFEMLVKQYKDTLKG